MLISSCASGEDLRKIETPPEALTAGAGPQKTALPLFGRKLRIPLWRELPPGVENIPVLTIELELVDLAGDPEGRFYHNALYRGLSVQDYAEELARAQTAEYQEMGEEALNNSLLIRSASLNWSYTEQFDVLMSSARILVISRNRFFYSGGAHGAYDTVYFVFDRKPAARIRLADILQEEFRPALKQLVNRELRINKELDPGDSLKKAMFFVDEADLSENFFFSPQGIGFHWDPYEIAPYVEGDVEAVVSFAELEPLLNSRGRELIQELRGEI
ncbi:MAG: DUF3298 and DUF4163 domain-containing protein [Treponema sp.]|nr:DUF3298 and DUF4163 domain-containing protein [Treponema sp.]